MSTARSRWGRHLLSGIGLPCPAPRGSHRLTGRRVPGLWLAGGQRPHRPGH
ncbi:hypothetical protein [Streptomyces sp. NPDC048665]|uniref:hypothetical protein n=1 Tax=unclassified Streptomyces TaxID=2593676 RepID=UPI00341B075A